MSRLRNVSPEEVGNLGAEIARHLSPQAEDSLVVVEGEDFVLVKRASSPPRERFEEMSSRTRSRFERLGLEPDEVERAVEWARESS